MGLGARSFMPSSLTLHNTYKDGSPAPHQRPYIHPQHRGDTLCPKHTMSVQIRNPQHSMAGMLSNPRTLQGRRCTQSHIQAAKRLPESLGRAWTSRHTAAHCSPSSIPWRLRCPVPSHHHHLYSLHCWGGNGHLYGDVSDGQQENRGNESAVCHLDACIYILPRRSIPL